MSGFRRCVLSFVSPFFFSGWGKVRLPVSYHFQLKFTLIGSTNFGKTPVTLKVFGVFNSNLKLIYL